MTDNDREKYFYANFPERVNALIRDPQLLRVWEEFGPEVFRRSAVLEGLDAFVRAHGFGGHCCVEVGTCNGLTALVLARYFGEVITIDIAPNDVKRDIAAHLGVTNIRFVDVSDNAEKAEVIKAMTFDGAFSDGDHHKDAAADFSLLRRCGQVLMHEYWPAQPAVFDLVNNLPRTNPGEVATQNKWALWRSE
jgi:predicted O-methyltransferase YrrM